MVDAVSPFQALVPGLENMVAALQKSKPTSTDQGTYEGNIATPANPLNAGTYGQPATPPPPSPPAPPIGGTAPPLNPFTQGVRPTPFLNASALFGQPPTAGSPFGAAIQKPNPIGQMQL